MRLASEAIPIFEKHVERLRTALRAPEPIVVVPEPDALYVEALLEALLTTAPRPDQAGFAACQSIGPSGDEHQWLAHERTIKRRLSRREVTASTFLRDLATNAAAKVGPAPTLAWLRAPLVDNAVGHLEHLADVVRRERAQLRVLLTGLDANVPPGLAHLARVDALERLANDDEGKRYLQLVLERGGRSDIDVELRGKLLHRLQGLEPSRVATLLARACAEVERDGDFVGYVRTERDRLLQNGALEVREVSSERTFAGLDVLDAHLRDVGALIRDLDDPNQATERQAVLDVLPKGMLLLGPPGCGKSLAAEVAASRLGVPLLQLHVGRLLDRYLGGSEQRLETALAMARAAAPCVLWIDELEKALGGLSSDEGGGTGRRMLGHLLGWMQENRHGVYVIATANSLDHLPPELLRRGRFDDHFAIKAPNERERAEILRMCLQRFDARLEDFQLDELVARTSGQRTPGDAAPSAVFSSADLEGLVQEAARLARLRDHADRPAPAHLDEALRAFKPQSAQWRDGLQALEEKLKRFDFRAASSAKGDAKPVSASRDPRQPLPKTLRALLEDSRFLLTYPLVEGWVLDMYTEDRTRLARLGAGDDSGVSSFAARGTYAVARDGSALLLTRHGQGADTPPSIVLEIDPGDESEQERLRLRVTGQEALPTTVTKPRRAEAIPEALLPYLWAERHQFPLEADEVGQFTAVMRSWGSDRGCDVWNYASRHLARYQATIDGPTLRLTPRWVDTTVASGPWLSHHAFVIRESTGGVGVEWVPFDRPANGVAPLDPAQPTPTSRGLLALNFELHRDAYQLRLSPQLFTGDLHVWSDSAPGWQHVWTTTIRADASGWSLSNTRLVPTGTGGHRSSRPKIARVRMLNPTSALLFQDGSTQQILCQVVP